MVKCAIYLRQSLDRNGDELAISRQRDDCLAVCREKNWTPTEFIDNDRSASNGKPRPAYTRMLKAIERGEIKAVVAWDLDRLHRRPIELETFMNLADANGLALATATGDVDLSTDNGRLFARIKGAVGMAEVERKSARQKAATAQHAKSGHPWWVSRPFGYDADLDPVTGKWWTYKRETGQHNPIRTHETEADLLHAAYKAVQRGTALGEIAARWNEAGVRTPSGTPWRGASVRQLLLSARNAGLRTHHGEVIGKGSWPRIVTEQTWRGVVALLSDPKRGGRAPRGRKRLLSGIATCGCCGHTIGSGITRGSGTLTLVCKHCGKVSRAEEPVNEFVIEAVVQRLSREDAIELTRREAIDTDDLRTTRESLRAQQSELGNAYAEQAVSHAAFLAADANLAKQIAEIDAQLTDSGKADVYDGLIGVEDVRAAFDGLDLSRQRAVVAALLSVVIHPVGRGARKFDAGSIDTTFRGVG